MLHFYAIVFFFQIVEPLLQFAPSQPSVLYDAADIVPAEVSVIHRSNARLTSAFRYNHKYIYSTEFFYFDQSDPNAARFFYDSVLLANFVTTSSFVNSTGCVPFPIDEKEALVTIIPFASLILTDKVVYRNTYTIHYEVEWHSLPYGHVGGRSYSNMGTITYEIRNIELAIVAVTSNIYTLNRDLQLQEIIFCNVTVTLPEV